MWSIFQFQQIKGTLIFLNMKNLFEHSASWYFIIQNTIQGNFKCIRNSLLFTCTSIYGIIRDIFIFHRSVLYPRHSYLPHSPLSVPSLFPLPSPIPSSSVQKNAGLPWVLIKSGSTSTCIKTGKADPVWRVGSQKQVNELEMAPVPIRITTIGPRYTVAYMQSA